MLAVIVQDRPDLHYAHGEDGRGIAAAGFQPRVFQSSGLVEPFDIDHIEHILYGRDHGVPFALAEANLNVEKGFRVFGGVLARFELPWSCPGITIVTRDRGLIGNLVASAGSGVERIALEDPIFERVFEAYGSDQVLGRVILTTTMLERLKELDYLAQARGFVCAFTEGQLLVALRGLRWRCPFWRIAQPTGAWLYGYRTWLLALIELPARIAKTLRLDPEAARAAPAASTITAPVNYAARAAATGEAVTVDLVRLVGELAMPALMIASGSLFGGLALVFGQMWWQTGFSPALGRWPLGMIVAGIIYGIYAIGLGLAQIGVSSVAGRRRCGRSRATAKAVLPLHRLPGPTASDRNLRCVAALHLARAARHRRSAWARSSPSSFWCSSS